MRATRNRYWVILIAAMFLANNVAAAAYSGIGRLGELERIAVLHDRGVHTGAPSDSDALCFSQCAAKISHAGPNVAAIGPDIISVPSYCAPRRTIRHEPALVQFALSPAAAGTPLPILFCNLRN